MRLTTEQIDYIKGNLAYNYKIIDRVLICLSIKSKIMDQPENEMIDALIFEASIGTLIDRYYRKNEEGYYTDEINTIDKDGIEVQCILDKLYDLFGLTVDVLVGKRKLKIGIEYPEELQQSSKESTDTLLKDVEAFVKHYPDWDIEALDCETIEYCIKKKLKYMMPQIRSDSQRLVEDLIYNPLNINGIRAFMYIIEDGIFHLPDDILRHITLKGQEVTLNEYIKIDKKAEVEDLKKILTNEHVNKIKEKAKRLAKKKTKKQDENEEPPSMENEILEIEKQAEILSSLGKGNIQDLEVELLIEWVNKENSFNHIKWLGLELKDMKGLTEFALSNFKEQFVYLLFYQSDYVSGESKENVYCLDALIHSIAGNTFSYFYGYKDKGNSIWRFLDQRDRSQKLYSKIDGSTIPDDNFDLSGIEEVLSDFVDTSYYSELPYVVPMPLILSKYSELLILILSVEHIGYTFTKQGEDEQPKIDHKTKKVIQPYGIETYTDRAEIPQFNENQILV